MQIENTIVYSRQRHTTNILCHICKLFKQGISKSTIFAHAFKDYRLYLGIKALGTQGILFNVYSTWNFHVHAYTMNINDMNLVLLFFFFCEKGAASFVLQIVQTLSVFLCMCFEPHSKHMTAGKQHTNIGNHVRSRGVRTT